MPKRESTENALPLTKAFAKKIEFCLGRSRFSGDISELAKYLNEKLGVSYDTIKTYQINENSKAKRQDPPEPKLYNACMLSKALGFSLDELRDEFIQLEPKKELPAVQHKLLDLLELHKNIKIAFPFLANEKSYQKDEPVFVDFLRKIKDVEDMEDIKTIAATYNKSHFIRYGKITERKSFIAELEKLFVSQNIERDNILGLFDNCPPDCNGSKLGRGCHDCKKIDAECVATKEFRGFIVCQDDLNEVSKKISLRREALDIYIEYNMYGDIKIDTPTAELLKLYWDIAINI